MTDKLKAFERQIEIFTIFYPSKKVNVFSVSGLAGKFKVDEKTIIKDFKSLQHLGFPIYQADTSGVRIKGEADPNVFKNLLYNYISTFHSEVIVSNSLYDFIYGGEITPVNNLRDILKAIESKVMIKIRYKTDIRNVVELTILPYQIITNKSKLEFIGIQNNTVDTYKFNNIMSIEGTSKDDSNNYDQIVEEFHQRHTYPSAKIKLTITTAKKDWIEDYMIFEITTTKIEDDIIGEEVIHFSLRGLSDLDLRYSEYLSDFSQDYFWNFSTWVIEQYFAIKVIDNETIRKAIHQIDSNIFLKSLKNNTTLPNCNKTDEVFSAKSANNDTSEKSLTPDEEIANSENKKDTSTLNKTVIEDKETEKSNNLTENCAPDLHIDKQLPTYDSFEIEFSIEELYNYRENRPQLNIIKRILKKWIA